MVSSADAFRALPVDPIGLPLDLPAKRYVAQIGRSERFGVSQAGLGHDLQGGIRVEVGAILDAQPGLNPVEDRLVEQVLLSVVTLDPQDLARQVQGWLAEPRENVFGQLDGEPLAWSILDIEGIHVGVAPTPDIHFRRYIVANGVAPSEVVLVTLPDLMAYGVAL